MFAACPRPCDDTVAPSVYVNITHAGHTTRIPLRLDHAQRLAHRRRTNPPRHLDVGDRRYPMTAGQCRALGDWLAASAAQTGATYAVLTSRLDEVWR